MPEIRKKLLVPFVVSSRSMVASTFWSTMPASPASHRYPSRTSRTTAGNLPSMSMACSSAPAPPADHMRDGGRIIVIGSVNAHTMPVAGGAIYGASKAAVAGLVRGWARDLGPRNILVNVIQPGPVDTDMNPAEGALAEVLRPLTALGRYGKPEEIANLAAFLASDEASYITGATIDIDGGMTI